VTAVAPLYVSQLADVSAERHGLVGFAFLTWLFGQAGLIAAPAPQPTCLRPGTGATQDGVTVQMTTTGANR
jgi:hypothetical protein